MRILNLSKPQWAWVLYDWANSAYYTTVMAGFFPIFFKTYWSGDASAAQSTLALGLGNSLASLLMVISAPLLGALADRGGMRIKMLTLSIAMGCMACGGLFLVGQGQWLAAVLLYVFGTFAIASGNTFYDALLLSVAKGETHRISAIAYGAGYLGGGILFLINVLMSLKPQLFGLADAAQGVKWSFLSVAIWWALFSLPIIFWVKEPDASEQQGKIDVKGAFLSIFQTVKEMRKSPQIWIFLLAFWFYIDGVHTAIQMAVDFGLSLGFDQSVLIGSLLIVQFVGFPAAIAVSVLAQRLSVIRMIQACVLVYIAVTFFAVNMTVSWHFYILAIIIGLVQGGVQSLSRSLFVSLIPTPSKTAEYCGFFNIMGKAAAITGPTLVGVVGVLSGSPRIGMSSIIVLFVIGLVILQYVKTDTN